MKNWKTTVGGLVVGIPQLLVGIGLVDGTNKWLGLSTAVGALLLGLFAKDHNVVGAGQTAHHVD